MLLMKTVGHRVDRSLTFSSWPVFIRRALFDIPEEGRFEPPYPDWS